MQKLCLFFYFTCVYNIMQFYLSFPIKTKFYSFIRTISNFVCIRYYFPKKKDIFHNILYSCSTMNEEKFSFYIFIHSIHSIFFFLFFLHFHFYFILFFVEKNIEEQQRKSNLFNHFHLFMCIKFTWIM